MKTLIRLLLEEQSDQGLHFLSFYLLDSHISLQRKPKRFNFRIFSILISDVPTLRGFHQKKCLLIAFQCRNWILWAVTVRIMFLLDQAGSLKIRWNLVLYARLYSLNYIVTILNDRKSKIINVTALNIKLFLIRQCPNGDCKKCRAWSDSS